jgi:hypothetical protein
MESWAVPGSRRGHSAATEPPEWALVIIVTGRPVSIMGFTFTGARITAIDGITEPERLSQLNFDPS